MSRVRSGITCSLMFMVATACAHGRSPSATGAGAASSPVKNVAPSDGISVTVALPLADATEATIDVLELAGYDIASKRGSHTLRTQPRNVGRDTSMVVTAQLFAMDASQARSLVVLSATHSVRSSNIRNAQVVYIPGTTSVLWSQLRAIEAALLKLKK